jgi:hypothetical protein
MFSAFAQCFSARRKKNAREGSHRVSQSSSSTSSVGSSTVAPSLPTNSMKRNSAVDDNGEVIENMRHLAAERRFAGQHVKVGRNLLQHSLVKSRLSDEHSLNS